MNKLDCLLPPSETMTEEEVLGLIRKTLGRELHDTHRCMEARSPVFLH